jgi:hypothetical protein
LFCQFDVFDLEPMPSLRTLAYWEGVILIAGFAVVILWKLATGSVSLEQLLEKDAADGNDASSQTSTGRVQCLGVTLVTAGWLLLQVMHDPRKFPTLPNSLIAALAGSQALYLAGKARDMLPGPRKLFRQEIP